MPGFQLVNIRSGMSRYFENPRSKVTRVNPVLRAKAASQESVQKLGPTFSGVNCSRHAASSPSGSEANRTFSRSRIRSTISHAPRAVRASGPITAELVSKRNSPICVMRLRTNQSPDAFSSQFLACRAWECSPTTNASQTLTSGKNVIEVETGKVELFRMFQVNQRKGPSLCGRRRCRSLRFTLYCGGHEILEADAANRGYRLRTSK